jgi:hypothetical protein
MDTGLINSNTHLGLNFAPSDELNFRKVTTCAPIAQDNYVKIYSAAEALVGTRQPLPGEQYSGYFFGPQMQPQEYNDTWRISTYRTNTSSEYSNQ